MSLTLIKSASYPWKNADVGMHEFKYSILPHTGTFAQGGVVQKSYELNNPLCAYSLGGAMQEQQYSFIKTDSENAVIETVKLAEDGTGYIVRIYDSHNAKANVKVKLAKKAVSVVECDMLENELQTVAENTDEFSLYLTNYQIKTIKVVL